MAKKGKSKPKYDSRSQIISCLRRTHSKSPMAIKAFEKALSKKKGPRGGKQYICKTCKKVGARNKVILDHIKPVVPVNTTGADMDLMTIHDNIFCKQSGLQILCKNCSRLKTNKENALRRKYKKEKTNE